MAEQLLPYALTTLARVKDLMTILSSNTGFDSVLTREINSVSDWIQQETNRNFLLKKYISEVRTQWGVRQKYITLKNAPVFYKTDIVSVVAGQNTLTLNDAGGVVAGMPIFGDGIASGSYITNVTGAVITVSVNFNTTSTTAHIFITGILNLQYRAGTPDNPSWTNFLPPQFELVDDGKAGLVRVYGFVSSIYNNTIKSDYWAGYLIDFTNAGNPLKHNLPTDLTRTAENLVIRAFKRREQAGKTSQTLETSTITFDRLIDDLDKQVLASYRRVPTVM